MKRIAGALLLLCTLTTCAREPVTGPHRSTGGTALTDSKHEQSSVLSSPADCAACVYGPHVFTRSKGKPVTETASFPGDPGADYIIDIRNGGGDDAKATVTLNGIVLLGSKEADESQQSGEDDHGGHAGKGDESDRGHLRQAVRLGIQNELQVRMTGEPGTSVTVAVVGGAKTVGATGGTVRGPGGGVQITIPAGALSSPVEISSALAPVTADGAGTIPGAVYEMGPSGTTFTTPAQLAIAYDPTKVPAEVSEDDLQLFHAVNGAWVAVAGSVVDLAVHRVTAPVVGFSAYGVGYAQPASITLTGGNGQLQRVNGRYQGLLYVMIRDGAGAPMQGVTVTFEVTAGGGLVFGNGKVKSDLNGIASMSAISPPTPGTQTVTAAVVGLPPVTFVERAVSPPGVEARCELTTTGAAYCWGQSGRGQIGDGSTTTRLIPTAVAGGLTFASLAEGGADHACGLTAGGAAYCWGANSFGELGDGSLVDKTTPTAVQGGLAFTTIAVGFSTTCALTSAGATYCWGWAGYGLFGDGTVGVPRTIPTLVATGGLAFVKLAVGFGYVCGLTSAGAAYCWGLNELGQLGDGMSIPRTVPTRVAGGLSFSSLATLDNHTCGVATSGLAYCWGDNSFGQLGDGTRGNRFAPTPVLGGLAFASITTSNLNSCAVTTAGAAYCWGYNFDGQVGDGTFALRTAPTPVLGGIRFKVLRARHSTTCGRATNGLPYCWGMGTSGELGTGLTTSSTTPVLVKWVEGAAGVGVSMVVNGGDGQSAWVNTEVPTPPSVLVRDYFNNPVSGVTVTFAVTSGGGSVTGGSATTDASGIASVESWTLGATAGASTLTATAPGLPATVFAATAISLASLVTGDLNTCGLAADGTAYCWGYNPDGELGDGTMIDRSTPARVTGGLVFASLATGEASSCGLTVAGAAYCWGDLLSPLLSPTPIAGGVVFVTLRLGLSHACGLTASGAAYCWGWNAYGELGDGTTTERTSPVPVAGGHVFTSLTAGNGGTCGLTAGGAAYCWGHNLGGILGDGTTNDRSVPTPVVGGLVFTSISTATFHTCGVTAGGAAYCWGSNFRGQLGDGSTTGSSTPVPVSGGVAFASLSAGFTHTCGRTAGGVAYCWGWNVYGQLGDGSITTRSTPASVSGGLTFVSLSSGLGHTCGLTSASAAHCWGLNSFGQLGDGTATNRSVPTPVKGP